MRLAVRLVWIAVEWVADVLEDVSVCVLREVLLLYAIEQCLMIQSKACRRKSHAGMQARSEFDIEDSCSDCKC